MCFYFTHSFLNRSTFHMDGPLFARPKCKTTLPPWPVLSSFNTHFFLHVMPVFSTFFYSWLMRKTVPPWPMQCKTILLPWPCEKAERGNPRFITSPSWLFPESKSPWPWPGLLLGHCTVVARGRVNGRVQWIFFDFINLDEVITNVSGAIDAKYCQIVLRLVLVHQLELLG